jgi:hypothetical protein
MISNAHQAGHDLNIIDEAEMGKGRRCGELMSKFGEYVSRADMNLGNVVRSWRVSTTVKFVQLGSVFVTPISVRLCQRHTMIGPCPGINTRWT